MTLAIAIYNNINLEGALLAKDGDDPMLAVFGDEVVALVMLSPVLTASLGPAARAFVGDLAHAQEAPKRDLSIVHSLTKLISQPFIKGTRLTSFKGERKLGYISTLALKG